MRFAAIAQCLGKFSQPPSALYIPSLPSSPPTILTRAKQKDSIYLVFNPHLVMHENDLERYNKIYSDTEVLRQTRVEKVPRTRTVMLSRATCIPHSSVIFLVWVRLAALSVALSSLVAVYISMILQYHHRIII